MGKHDRDDVTLAIIFLTAAALLFSVFWSDERPQQVENEGETPCYSTPTKM